MSGKNATPTPLLLTVVSSMPSNDTTGLAQFMPR
jgi:hypothetical protein